MPRTATSILALLPLAGTALPTLPALADGVDPSWDLIGRIEVEERIDGDRYMVMKRFPPELDGGAPVFEISGFLYPAGFEAETTEFILVPEAGMCPFCGSPDHGTAIAVSMADPMPSVEGTSRVVLRGTLHAVTDPETFQAVVMTGAVAIEG